MAKTLTGATLENGTVTVNYSETLMGATTVGSKTLKKGDATTALQTACSDAMGQPTTGFQVYTTASDHGGDGNLIDIFRAGEAPFRAESAKIDKALGKARDDFRAAAQAALESGAEEL